MFAQISYGFVASMMTSLAMHEYYNYDYLANNTIFVTDAHQYPRIGPGSNTRLVFAALPFGTLGAVAATFIPVGPRLKYVVSNALAVGMAVMMALVQNRDAFVAGRFIMSFATASAVFTLVDTVVMSRIYAAAFTSFFFLGALISSWVLWKVEDHYESQIWFQLVFPAIQIVLTLGLPTLTTFSKPTLQPPAFGITAAWSFFSHLTGFQVMYYFFGYICINFFKTYKDDNLYIAIAHTICFGVAAVGGGLRPLLPQTKVVCVGYFVGAVFLGVVIGCSSKIKNWYEAVSSVGAFFLYMVLVAKCFLVIPTDTKYATEHHPLRTTYRLFSNIALFIVMYATPVGLNKINHWYFIVFAVIDLLLGVALASGRWTGLPDKLKEAFESTELPEKRLDL